MSKFFAWSDEYKIGNVVIDQQHKDLFALINTLHEGQRDPEVQKKCFASLKDYAIRHFVTEEETMRAYGYPDLEKHQAEHQHFARKVDDFCKVLDDGSTVVMESVMVYLKNWLSHHVLKSDRELIKYLVHTSP